MKLLSKLHSVFFPRQLTILAYHSIVRTPMAFPVWSFLEEASFRSQMAYLKEHFRVVSLTEGVRQIKKGDARGPLIAITFDDGYQNNFDVAFPILRENGLPATVFLATGFVGTPRVPWDCQLFQALAGTRKSRLEWNGKRFTLSRPGERAGAFREIGAALKARPHHELLSGLRGVLDRLGHDPEVATEEFSPCRMLSRSAVTEMAESGLVEFGAHTHSHAILSHLSGSEKRKEIERSIVAVQDLTGRPCRLFAYPNGRPGDYDRESIEILKECGVRTAVTTREGPNGANSHSMELNRVGIGGGRNMIYFRLKIHHLSGLLRNLSQFYKRTGRRQT